VEEAEEAKEIQEGEEGFLQPYLNNP